MAEELWAVEVTQDGYPPFYLKDGITVLVTASKKSAELEAEKALQLNHYNKSAEAVRVRLEVVE